MPRRCPGRPADTCGLGARSCASGKVGASLTKRVKKARKVVVKVNGRKAAVLKGRSLHKRSLALAAPSSSKVTVAATVTLKNRKRPTVSRSHLACS